MTTQQKLDITYICICIWNIPGSARAGAEVPKKMKWLTML